jgi:hypothetical protein
MDREYTSDKVPDKLTRRIQASSIAGRFRRRAALMKGNARWELSTAQSRAFCPAKAFRRRGPNETPSMTLVSARGRHRHGSRRAFLFAANRTAHAPCYIIKLGIPTA